MTLSITAAALLAMQMPAVVISFVAFPLSPAAHPKSISTNRIDTSALYTTTEKDQRQQLIDPFTEIPSSNPTAVLIECEEDKNVNNQYETDCQKQRDNADPITAEEVKRDMVEDNHEILANHIDDDHRESPHYQRYIASKLLQRRSAELSRSESQANRVSDKMTSDGDRRERNATRARKYENCVLLNTIKNKAFAAAAAKSRSAKTKDLDGGNTGSHRLAITRSKIQSVIDGFIDAKDKDKSSVTSNMGILGPRPKDISVLPQRDKDDDIGHHLCSIG